MNRVLPALAIGLIVGIGIGIFLPPFFPLPPDFPLTVRKLVKQTFVNSNGDTVDTERFEVLGVRMEVRENGCFYWVRYTSIFERTTTRVRQTDRVRDARAERIHDFIEYERLIGCP